MSIDIKNESLLTMPEAAAWLTEKGKRISMHSLYRWRRVGVQAADGGRCYLECVRLGGSLLTSVEALQRLADALNDVEAAERQRVAELARPKGRNWAAEELERMGA
jgi:hypothetical protein